MMPQDHLCSQSTMKLFTYALLFKDLILYNIPEYI